MLKYDPQNVKAYFRAAKAYRGLEKKEEAIANGRRALELSKNDKIIQEFVELLEKESKDSKKVEEIEKKIKSKEERALEKKKAEEKDKVKIEEESKEESKEMASNGQDNPLLDPEMARKMMENMSEEDLQHQCDMLKQMPP